MSSERGQATVEWVAVVLVVAVVLAALVAVGPRIDGRSFGGFLAHSFICAVQGDCRARDSRLLAVHGAGDAELLRRYSPEHRVRAGHLHAAGRPARLSFPQLLATRPDDQRLDVHSSKRGAVPATAFTHVVHSRGETFLQYWLYYPDSTSTVANAAGIWNTVTQPLRGGSSYPGWHGDDWESYFVRIGPDGSASVRASSHHGYQGCKQLRCANEWTPWTGWTRVSRGSHAGHIPLRDRGGGLIFDSGGVRIAPHDDQPVYPGLDVQERTTTGAGLRLVPVRDLEAATGDAMWDRIKAPWDKEVFRDPRSDSTG